MKSVRHIGAIAAIVLLLLSAACSTSADEATQISSADSAAVAADGGDDQEAMNASAAGAENSAENSAENPDEASEPELNPVDDSTTGSSADDDVASSVDSVGTGFLARVSDATIEASTGRFEGRFAMSAAPGTDPGGSFELTMNGSYDLAADAFDVYVDLSDLAAVAAADSGAGEADMFAAMFAEPVQLRSIAGTAWVRWGLLAGMLGAVTAEGDSAWIEAEADEATSMTGQFGVEAPESPTDLLRTLAEMEASVTEVGTESVRGAETTHYQVVIDLEAAAASLPPAERAELEAEFPGGISGELPIELWMDGNGMLRRLLVQLDDFESMGAESGADEIGSLVIELEIFDVGEAVTIERPPADQVVTTDELGFSLDDGF